MEVNTERGKYIGSFEEYMHFKNPEEKQQLIINDWILEEMIINDKYCTVIKHPTNPFIKICRIHDYGPIDIFNEPITINLQNELISKLRSENRKLKEKIDELQ